MPRVRSYSTSCCSWLAIILKALSYHTAVSQLKAWRDLEVTSGPPAPTRTRPQATVLSSARAGASLASWYRANLRLSSQKKLVTQTNQGTHLEKLLGREGGPPALASYMPCHSVFELALASLIHSKQYTFLASLIHALLPAPGSLEAWGAHNGWGDMSRRLC